MIKLRRENYINKIEEGSISLFYSGEQKHKSNDQFFPFSVNRNFFYLTNIDQANVVLVVIKGKNKSESFLFIEKQDPIKALWDGKTLTFEEASTLSGIKLINIKDINTLDTFINTQLGISRANIFGEIDKVYFDLEKIKVNDFLTNTELIANKLKNNYPSLQILNSQRKLASLRMYKDELEIKDTLEAINITNKALKHVLNALKPGLREFEIEAEYNYILNKNNTETSFDTIAASGKNATILHYVDNDDIINDNELILFDLGVKYNNYCSDISRTYPANGKFSTRQKQIYEIVLKANKETIKWLKPGRTIKEFNDFGKQILIDGLKEIGLIKEDSEITKYYYHSLGHYLGLDVHDVGLYDEVIKEGAIITVEPGLYIEEESIGIRIEDDILITKDGAINLSKDIIKEVKDIEEYMKNR
jgi:Xaa-Pro aminopeptidase